MAKIDDSVKKKVPELRFPGFTDDWEERKLGELSNIVGGGTPSTSNPEYWDGDIDWYAPAEIGEQSYVSKSKKTITELGLKKSSARILPVGTVLFTSRAGIGNTAILAKEATTNQGFQSIVPDQNKLDSYFIFSRTNELKRYGEVTGAGSTFVEVSGKQMSKMSIMVPELSEQQKIGSFFKQLDDTIVLHQRKLDLLKEQKKGYLQKMFPKNGEKVPELRFAGFADDWEQRKLGNLSEITDTKHATAPVVDFETPYKMIRTSAVRDGRLFPDRMDYVTYDTYEQWSERIHLKPNDVVISREAPMGEAAVIPTDNNKYFLGQRMVGIRVFDDLDPFFLLSTFLAPKFRKEIQIRNAESTTVANFGIPSIKGYEVDIPEKEEQTKIGSFFRQLDNTIALHQRKLDLLKKQKKGFLQKMFV
ncbi:MAG: restriction endonuclease subunit S [Lactococcus lactis]|nr:MULTISPECIES: restriction endonuclease subunit S [Lactococcus]MDS1011825.1 restriction endonuclease subunit S [Lactococcus lactis]MDS1011834.1 restriction endonuclease subunit S [Lactococcus lactis]TKD79655.1 restriction endonuclease subunit S [Lactococcus lactis]UXV62244.1 restriction endonuclease subunit S [Lactococcus cremoris]WGU42679.1 restriction endonuclease subunit S [Lactococcus lactis subsp. lactis]